MEKSVGFLEGVRGHTYDTIYDLLFTTKRVIALIVQHPADVPFKFGVTELLFGGQTARRLRRFERKNSSAEDRLSTYQEKTLEELLAGHRFNFEIPYSTVMTIKMTRRFLDTRLKFHIDSPSIIGHAIQFTLAEDQVHNAQKLLNLVLPLKAKEK
jgi:hypothetical protein